MTYFAIAPLRGLPLGKGLIEAAKAGVLSLTAFQVGLFGWMGLIAFVFFPHPHLHPDSAAYWFLMQIGMAPGFLTAYPVNAWLSATASKRPGSPAAWTDSAANVLLWLPITLP